MRKLVAGLAVVGAFGVGGIATAGPATAGEFPECPRRTMFVSNSTVEPAGACVPNVVLKRAPDAVTRWAFRHIRRECGPVGGVLIYDRAVGGEFRFACVRMSV